MRGEGLVGGFEGENGREGENACTSLLRARA